MMTKRTVGLTRLVLILTVLLSAVRVESQQLAPSAPPPSATLTLFQNEAQAQAHCPQDKVVWLNLSSGIYHFKGQRWYANTNHGAFVCEKEADKTGSRATENGQ
jgi:hypothetical protein